ncbi:MAG TPA: ribosomal-processing cysteine protease Prp [Bacillota bacterium]|nr:ribosomal-processing cysteine protease Prp [Bacillota bacterium]
MIKVTVYRKRNELTGFELSGHAESGPYGYDLVCAGVSAVSFGAINAVMELCNVDLSITQGRSGGYLRVEIPDTLSESNKQKAILLFEGMVISLETIERDYDAFITIENKQEV